MSELAVSNVGLRSWTGKAYILFPDIRRSVLYPPQKILSTILRDSGNSVWIEWSM